MGPWLACYSWSSFTRDFADSCTAAEEFRFVLSGQLTTAGRVLNVIPGDFNRDGKLDLLVMTEPSPPKRVALDMTLYLSPPRGFGMYMAFDRSNRRLKNSSNLAESAPISLVSSTPAQPIAIDAGGMMKIDLLGFVPSASRAPQLVLWNNTRADPSVATGDFFQT
jgi:integrin alpha FG-GAP repeat containing protein 1